MVKHFKVRKNIRDEIKSIMKFRSLFFRIIQEYELLCFCSKYIFYRIACSRWAFRTSGFWFLFFMISSRVAPVIARWNFAKRRDFFLVSCSTFMSVFKINILIFKIDLWWVFLSYLTLLVLSPVQDGPVDLTRVSLEVVRSLGFSVNENDGLRNLHIY